MSSTKRHGRGLFIILLLIGLAYAGYRGYTWYNNEQANIKSNIENEFYKPIMLNDSTLHMNITDSSCVMIQIDNDTVVISSHNAMLMHYNVENHKFMIIVDALAGPNKIVKEMDLDTIFKRVPNKAILHTR